MIGILKDHKYPGDPVSAWKLRISTDTNEEQDEDSLSDDKSSDYNYLLGMPMWNMSLEKKNDLLRERDKKVILKDMAKFCASIMCILPVFHVVQQERNSRFYSIVCAWYGLQCHGCLYVRRSKNWKL